MSDAARMGTTFYFVRALWCHLTGGTIPATHYDVPGGVRGRGTGKRRETQEGAAHWLGKALETRPRSCIVICRADASGNKPGPYQLATRTVFESPEAAGLYARTIAQSREAIVIPLDVWDLRVGEERGTLGYWAGARRR